MHTTGPKPKLSTESFSSITDGTSNTICVTEWCTLTNNRRRTFWANSYTSYNQSTAQPFSLTMVPNYTICDVAAQAGKLPGIDNSACKRATASFHSGGMNALKADGSVTFIKQSINMRGLDGLGDDPGGRDHLGRCHVIGPDPPWAGLDEGRRGRPRATRNDAYRRRPDARSYPNVSPSWIIAKP